MPLDIEICQYRRMPKSLELAPTATAAACCPPLGSPWDAIQIGAQAWAAHARSH